MTDLDLLRRAVTENVLEDAPLAALVDALTEAGLEWGGGGQAVGVGTAATTTGEPVTPAVCGQSGAGRRSGTVRRNPVHGPAEPQNSLAK